MSHYVAIYHCDSVIGLIEVDLKIEQHYVTSDNKQWRRCRQIEKCCACMELFCFRDGGRKLERDWETVGYGAESCWRCCKRLVSGMV